MLYTHLATAILFSSLIVLAVIDFRTQRLPNLITLPLAAVGIAVHISLFDAYWPPLLGAVAGYLSLVGVELAYRRLRGHDGLGRGDAKLMAAGGAWCGGWLLPHIALAGAGSALIYVLVLSLLQGQQLDARMRIAFGPWLALGIALAWTVRAYAPGLVNLDML